jgi:hypothetical protein
VHLADEREMREILRTRTSGTNDPWEWGAVGTEHSGLRDVAMSPSVRPTRGGRRAARAKSTTAPSTPGGARGQR